MDKDKLEMKALMKSAEVANYLMGLADGFKAGRIVVEQGADSLTLLPADMAEVEIEAKVKKDKARFSLELSWRLPSEEDSGEAMSIGAAPAAKPAGKPADAKAEDKDAKKDEKKDEKVVCSVTGAKPEAKPEAKPAAKPAAPTASKPEAKPESKDAKPAPAAAPVPASKPAAK